jgi:CHAT domain
LTRVASNDLHIQINSDSVRATFLRIGPDNKLQKTSTKMANKKFDLKEYVKLIGPIENESLKSSGNASQYDSEHMALGKFLFDFIFAAPLDEFFHKSYVDDIEKEERLRLRLFVNDPKLANVAWEFVYDPKLDRYLGILPRTPLTRFLGDDEKLVSLLLEQKANVAYRPENPAHLLFVPSNAIGQPYIDAEDEIAEIKKQLAAQNMQSRIQIKTRDAPKPTWNEVFKELTEGARSDSINGYNVLHFYGHGDFKAGEATLIFQNDVDKGPDVIRPQRFSQLLDLPLSKNMKLVFLNACNGAKASEENLNSGLAQSLFIDKLSNVSSVVAMQFTINIEAAAFIAQNLYLELGKGAALEEALQSIRAMLFNSPLFPGKRFFATPVIFMNTRDGYVFGLPDFKKEISDGRETKITGNPQPLSAHLEVESKMDILHECYQVIDDMIQVIRISETLRGKSSAEVKSFANTINPTIVNFTSGYTGLVGLLIKAFPSLRESILREAEPLKRKIAQLALPFAKNANIQDVGDFLQSRLDEIRRGFEDFWKFVTKVMFYETIGAITR